LGHGSQKRTPTLFPYRSRNDLMRLKLSFQKNKTTAVGRVVRVPRPSCGRKWHGKCWERLDPRVLSSRAAQPRPLEEEVPSRTGWPLGGLMTCRVSEGAFHPHRKCLAHYRLPGGGPLQSPSKRSSTGVDEVRAIFSFTFPQKPAVIGPFGI